MRGRPCGQVGFSYLEVLIAGAVLSLGIMGVFGAMSRAVLDISQGGRETIAAEQAQAILERIRNAATFEDLLSYADTPPAGATSPRPAYVQQSRDAWLSALSAGTPGGLGQGQGRITIAPPDGVAPSRMARVTVNINWIMQTGPAELSFATRVSEWP